MNRAIGLTGLSVASMLLLCSMPTSARTVETAQSKACSAQATKQGLVGEQRDAFRSACLKGALTPEHPTTLDKGPSAAAITAPSGENRTTRSKACNAEAARRGLQGAGYESFRKGCLASAAPVTAIETSLRPTRPTPALPKIESMTNKPPS